MNQNTPDIYLFQSWKHRGDPFAKYDYMGVLPVLSHLEAYMKLCSDMRGNGMKLPDSFLKNEDRAFIAIQENQYVTTHYPWERAVTDCWNTTVETWWEDFLKEKEKWGEM